VVGGVASTSTAKSTRAPARSTWPLVAGLAGLGVIVTLLALFVGGALPVHNIPGLPSAGTLTTWLAPLAKLTSDLSAVCTVGLLLAAAALLPSSREVLSTAAIRAARLASATAIVWAIAALASLLLTLSETLALPLADVVKPNTVMSYVSQVPQGGAWLTTAALACITAVVAFEADRLVGAWTALALAIFTLLPPAFTGHAASAGDHDVATSSLVLHIACVTVWVGGLLALVWYANVDGRFIALAVRRFSPLALVCYVSIGVSGVVNAYIRIPEVSDLWSTGYGRLLTAKTVAFVVLGCFGWWHRRRTIPDLERGEANAFKRFALCEGAVMVTTIALAVALSQSPPPPTGQTAPPTPAEILVGFPMPGPPTISGMFTTWRLDLLVVAVLAFLAIGYGWGLRQLHRRGDSWPIGRAFAWYGGLAIVAFATLSGFGEYGRIVFSIHMTQHMVLSMLAPILLVVAAPITLAMRALPAAGRNQPTGAREWLIAALNSTPVKILTHPVTAFVLFITAPYTIYFSGLFEVAMRQHWAHEAMHVHFVLVGFLFYESLIGTDPLPYRAGYPVRLLTLFSSLVFHAFFAIALMSSNGVIASSFYEQLNRPWWPDLLTDQNTGAAIAWAFGELPSLIAMVVLLYRWSQDDDRTARRLDRQADRDHDAELKAYNQMLKDRAAQDPRSF
jgi:cytochrome c oxidase assembly factor CtaG/putative copper export protein